MSGILSFGALALAQDKNLSLAQDFYKFLLAIVTVSIVIRACQQLEKYIWKITKLINIYCIN